MRNSENDPIGAAFADFRHQETPRVKLAGMAAVRAAVRRRRNVRVAAAAAVLTAIAIASPVAGYAYVSGRHYAPAPVSDFPNPITSPSPHATADSSSVAPDPSTPSSSSPSGLSSTTTTPQVSTCRAAQLTGSVTEVGGMMSQPYVIIALANTSGSPCQLTGYPKISATGYAQSTPSATGTLSITVTDGRLYIHTDPGPQRIELAPHGSASFALGTNTAYGASIYTITNVGVIVPGDETGVSVTVNRGLGASAPDGQPIPIKVTAFVSGSAGPH